MEKKINIAELLKDCPKGMELYSPLFGDCKFVKVHDYEAEIIVELETGATVSFLTDGRYYDYPNAECILFPKGKTTWEGFQRPFKDGDIVATTNGSWIGITEGGKNNSFVPTYCVIDSSDEFEAYLGTKETWAFNRLATEEEKEKLFQAIKDNGYEWNEETKTLEKVPKFKVGDRIILKDNPHNIPSIRIKAVTKSQYMLESDSFLYISNADEKYVLEDKFNITTLKPFDKVLVRDHNAQEWVISLFSHYNALKRYKYTCVNGSGFSQCIPYEGNEHLSKTTDDCDEYFKTWE